MKEYWWFLVYCFISLAFTQKKRKETSKKISKKQRKRKYERKKTEGKCYRNTGIKKVIELP